MGGDLEELDHKIWEIWAIDTHAHPFTHRVARLSADHLAGLLAIGRPAYEGSVEGDLRDLIAYRFAVRELSKLLGAGSPEEALSKRSRLAEEDFRGYVEMLLKHARINGFVIDDGYSEARGEHALPLVRIDEFESYLPEWVSVKYLHRIEPDIKRLYEESTTFSDFSAGIEDMIERYAKDPRYAGFKSIIAYRTGLELSWRGEDEARREFERCKAGSCERSWFGPVMRAVREYVLSLVVEKSGGFGKVVQVHTGIGDSDIVLPKSFPHLIFDFLKDERARRTRIILVHGGYPSVAMASYLVNAFSNVYMDLSIASPFGMANLEQRIREALELAPFSKVMYASDGYYVPEIHWIGAVAFRKALASALKSLTLSGFLTYDEAVEAASKILSGNAISVYGFQLGLTA